MRIEYHGGGCCGIKHLAGFPANPQLGRTWQQEIQASRHEDGDGLGEFSGNLIEVTLTDVQMSRDLYTALLAEGFRVVTRFVNHNTGHWISVLHRHEDGDIESGHLDFWDRRYNLGLAPAVEEAHDNPAPVPPAPPPIWSLRRQRYTGRVMIGDEEEVARWADRPDNAQVEEAIRRHEGDRFPLGGRRYCLKETQQ